MTSTPKITTSNLYARNINRTLNYISKNLDKNLTLDELADISFFSKFHFHRIFKALIDETVYDFIRRLRLEKATYQLIIQPTKPIIDIGLESNFSSSQNFVRAFKSFYSLTPSQFREQYKLILKNKIDDIISKQGNDNPTQTNYTTITSDKHSDLVQLKHNPGLAAQENGLGLIITRLRPIWSQLGKVLGMVIPSVSLQ
jgi:AraC-like DNA-binding protein